MSVDTLKFLAEKKTQYRKLSFACMSSYFFFFFLPFFHTKHCFFCFGDIIDNFNLHSSSNEIHLLKEKSIV